MKNRTFAQSMNVAEGEKYGVKYKIMAPSAIT
jgi:hypothetical protein